MHVSPLRLCRGGIASAVPACSVTPKSLSVPTREWWVGPHDDALGIAAAGSARPACVARWLVPSAHGERARDIAVAGVGWP